MKKNYDEVTVARRLRAKGVNVDTINNTVEVPYNTDTCGNGSWGKIDFLCNHRGYILLRVAGTKYKAQAQEIVTDEKPLKVFEHIVEAKKQVIKKQRKLN